MTTIRGYVYVDIDEVCVGQTIPFTDADGEKSIATIVAAEAAGEQIRLTIEAETNADVLSLLEAASFSIGEDAEDGRAA